jgi:hypothetical protein
MSKCVLLSYTKTKQEANFDHLAPFSEKFWSNSTNIIITYTTLANEHLVATCVIALKPPGQFDIDNTNYLSNNGKLVDGQQSS